MNHCKNIGDLCESFDYLSYISQEESLVCNICVTYPSQGDSHTPRRFTYNIKNDDICKSTKLLSRDFRNLKTHVKRHFENEVHLKNDCDWQKKRKIIKANMKQENMQWVWGSEIMLNRLPN